MSTVDGAWNGNESYNNEFINVWYIPFAGIIFYVGFCPKVSVSEGSHWTSLTEKVAED